MHECSSLVLRMCDLCVWPYLRLIQSKYQQIVSVWHSRCCSVLCGHLYRSKSAFMWFGSVPLHTNAEFLCFLMYSSSLLAHRAVCMCGFSQRQDTCECSDQAPPKPQCDVCFNLLTQRGTQQYL